MCSWEITHNSYGPWFYYHFLKNIGKQNFKLSPNYKCNKNETRFAKKKKKLKLFNLSRLYPLHMKVFRGRVESELQLLT